jgi:hypothetical protein
MLVLEKVAVGATMKVEPLPSIEDVSFDTECFHSRQQNGVSPETRSSIQLDDLTKISSYHVDRTVGSSAVSPSV